jgi:hypothetical protein
MSAAAAAGQARAATFAAIPNGQEVETNVVYAVARKPAA